MKFSDDNYNDLDSHIQSFLSLPNKNDEYVPESQFDSPCDKSKTSNHYQE